MTAYEIYKTFNRGEKREYYEIVIRFNTDDIDGAVELIQECFGCDEKTARESLELFDKAVDELVKKRGGYQKQKNKDFNEGLLIMRRQGWKAWQNKTSQSARPVEVQISSHYQD